MSPDAEAQCPAASSNAQSYTSSGSLDSFQLRAAGLSPEDAFTIPPPPFPHGPPTTSKDGFNSTKLQQELADLEPPLFAVNAASKTDPVNRKSKRPALRQTHLGVLTTILHHCLLEGDYDRAGRAWGMILRTQIAGVPIDTRNHARWGIGAEILLRRNAQPHSNKIQDPEDNKQSTRHQNDIYTEEGFELAREYYERLIVQYPNRKHVPYAVDDRTFYPAMFSLWIYEVCEKSKRARQQHEEGMSKTDSESASIDEDTTMDYSLDAHAHLIAIKTEELRRAREIADRLDQLVVSPPFDKDANLLQLRGMVGLWLGDLIFESESSGEGDAWELGLEDEESSNVDVRTERLRRYTDSRTEFQQALDYFERAFQASGRRLTEHIIGAEAKIDDITKWITKLAA